MYHIEFSKKRANIVDLDEAAHKVALSKSTLLANSAVLKYCFPLAYHCTVGTPWPISYRMNEIWD